MEQQKIWDYYQNNNEIGDAAFVAYARYRFIASHVSPGSKVLNIGVGRGGLEQILSKKEVEQYSLDPSEESIATLRSSLRMGERARVGYSQAMPFDENYFDVVIMSEVLEHLSDDVLHKTIEEVKRVLKHDGSFIGTVPADENIKGSTTVCPGCGCVFHRWGHVQSFSKQKIFELIGEKFNSVLIKRDYFGNWELLNWKGKIIFLIKKIFISLGAYGSGETFFFVMKNKK